MVEQIKSFFIYNDHSLERENIYFLSFSDHMKENIKKLILTTAFRERKKNIFFLRPCLEKQHKLLFYFHDRFYGEKLNKNLGERTSKNYFHDPFLGRENNKLFIFMTVSLGRENDYFSTTVFFGGGGANFPGKGILLICKSRYKDHPHSGNPQ